MNESEELLKKLNKIQALEKKYPDLYKRGKRYFSSLVKNDFDEVSIEPSCSCYSCNDYSLCLKIRNKNDDVYADTNGIYIGDNNYGDIEFNPKEDVIETLVKHGINLKAMKAIEEFVQNEVNEQEKIIIEKSQKLEKTKLNWNLP